MWWGISGEKLEISSTRPWARSSARFNSKTYSTSMSVVKTMKFSWPKSRKLKEKELDWKRKKLLGRLKKQSWHFCWRMKKKRNRNSRQRQKRKRRRKLKLRKAAKVALRGAAVRALLLVQSVNKEAKNWLKFLLKVRAWSKERSKEKTQVKLSLARVARSASKASRAKPVSKANKAAGWAKAVKQVEKIT